MLLKEIVCTQSHSISCLNVLTVFRLPWRRYALDEAEKDEPESEEEILDIKLKPAEPVQPTSHSTPSIDLSDDNGVQSDEDNRYTGSADYKQNENHSSGSDTGDEIDRVLQRNNNGVSKQLTNTIADDVYNRTTDEEQKVAADSRYSPVEPLPNFFKSKTFYLSSNLGSVEEIKLKRYITVYGGQIVSHSSDANFILSNNDKMVSASFCGEVVRPLWVLECNDLEMMLPTDRYKFT